MKLVIQAKTNDNMKELKGWVEKYFGAITNKKLGPQDFALTSRAGPKSLACGTQPWAGCEHEMIFGQSYQDTNMLDLYWTLNPDKQRFKKKSMELVEALLIHEGQGSLYQCLKQMNYVL